jgi:hypothetical protein
MLATDQVLESMQADILGILQHTPSIKGHVFADNEGDFSSRLEKSLGTKNAGSTGKRGLAVIVLEADVIDAEKNLPGPVFQIRARVMTIENIVVNRSPAKGTLQRSSQAALNILAALHLANVGSYALYAEKTPITPQQSPDGISSHIVTIYCRANGLQGPGKPSAVEVEMVTSLASIRVVGPGLDQILLADGAGGWSSGGSASPPAVGAWASCTRPNSWVVESWFSGDFMQAWQSPGEGLEATPDLAEWPPEISVTVAATDVLSLTCATPGAAIRYTLDGTYPTPTNGTLYTAPLAAPASGTTVRAAAYKEGLNPGDCLEFTITDSN